MQPQLEWPSSMEERLRYVLAHPSDTKARSQFVDEAAAIGRGDEALRELETLAHQLTSAGQGHVAEALLEHMAAMKMALSLENSSPRREQRQSGSPVGMPRLFDDE